MVNVAGVLIRKCKAYLAINAQIPGGPYVQVEPVYVTNLTVGDLTAAFERVIAAGHPNFDEKTQTPNVILKATGAHNWKELMQDSADYIITWEPDKITLYLPTWDANGQLEGGPERSQIFPLNTPLPRIIEAILADARKFSFLGVP